MAMKVRYTVVNGEVLSENRGGVKRDYLPDTQGNTIGLIDSTQTITDTFSYFPYGEVATRTGTTATPFQFLGTLGYYRDSASRTYVRARTLNTAQGRWMTQDPIGFDGGDYNLYRYVENNVVTWSDPSGLDPCSDGSCDGPGRSGTGGGNNGTGGGGGSNLSCWAREFLNICRSEEMPTSPYFACVLAKKICGLSLDPFPDCSNVVCPSAPTTPILPSKAKYRCTNKCGCVGETPPCGKYYFGEGEGKDEVAACKAAKAVACGQCHSPCSPKHANHCDCEKIGR